MKSNILILFTFCTSLFAQWSQQEFVIGALGDPALTGEPGQNGITNDHTRLENFKSAGFNTMLGFCGIGSVAASDYYAMYPNPALTNNPWIGYRLARMNHVQGLKSFFWEERIIVGPFAQTLTDITGLPIGTPIRGTATLPLQFQSMAFRNLQLGYLIGGPTQNSPDEPNLLQVDTITGPLQNALHAYDPTMASVVSLRSNWGSTWSDYSTYLDHYLDLPSTKIVFYNYYIFENNQSEFTNGYHRLAGGDDGNARVSYFRTLNLLATKVKLANANGRNISMWGYGGWVEHEIVETNGTSRHYANLDARMLGYASYAQLLYGAKGILYYGYELDKTSGDQEHFNSPAPSSPYHNPANHSSLQEVYVPLGVVGSKLMLCTWERTVHGHSTDPVSTETNLDVIDSNTPFHYSTSRNDALTPGAGTNVNWSADSLAIGLLKKGVNDYMLVLNKSVYRNAAGVWTGYNNINKTKYRVKGKVIPQKLNKTNGTWERISNSQYDALIGSKGSTTFEVTVSPGNAELTRALKPGVLAPSIVNLLN